MAIYSKQGFRDLIELYSISDYFTSKTAKLSEYVER